MASSDMSLSSEHVQRLLQCAVCLERFTQPKLLPCQHTFCLRPCLEGLIDHRTRSIRCPECRADHFVPRNGVASFPNNLTVIGFLELSEQATRASGQSAESSGEVILSNSRQQYGQRAASPPIGPVDAAGAESAGCYVCHSEGRIVRCFHCDRLVCDQCHHAHLEQVKSELTRMISQVRRGLPQITEQIVILGRKGCQLQSNCECVKAEVTEAMEKHIRELKARERTLREDIDAFLAGELRAMRSHQETAEVEIASLASFCDSAESLLSTGRRIPEGDLVEMKRQCEDHLETVNCYQDGTVRPPNLKQIQASLESPFLTSTISNFGDLIITSRGSHTLTVPDRDDVIRRDTPESRVQVPAQRNTVPDRDEDDRARNSRASVSVHRNTVPDRGDEERTRSSRASVPAQREDVAARVRAGLDLGLLRGVRSVSYAPTGGGSPLTSRRAPSIASTAQPVYADESTGLENNYASPRVSRVPGRRSRDERRSDTRLVSMASAERQPLYLRSRDRTRHLSLGAMPVSVEFSDDSPDRDYGLYQTGTVEEEGEDEDNEEEEDPPDQLAATFPGARAPHSLPAPLRFDVTLSDPEPRDIDSLGTLVGWNSPSIYVNSPRNRYNQKGTAVTTFGTRGSEPQSFTWPRGVAVSPLTDNIFIADSSNHRVQVFDDKGRYLKTFGTYGQGEAEFDCLAGIAVNGLGQIIIADRYNHRIQVLDRNGAFRNSFGSEGTGPGQLNYPWGVACDTMGFIYVCDKENHRIQVFQFNGTFVRQFGHLGNRDGQFENPHYVAISNDNKVYVSDSSNHRIQVFSTYGDFLFSFGSCGTLRGQLKFPRGIAIDNQGFVVVADSGNNRIQVFRADGRFYSMFGSWGSETGNFKGLEGVAILANGNIVVSDRENHRIQIF